MTASRYYEVNLQKIQNKKKTTELNLLNHKFLPMGRGKVDDTLMTLS